MHDWNIIVILAQVILKESPASTCRNWLENDIFELPLLDCDLLDHEFFVESEHVVWIVLVKRKAFELLQEKVAVQTIQLECDILG